MEKYEKGFNQIATAYCDRPLGWLHVGGRDVVILFSVSFQLVNAAGKAD